MRVHPYPLAFVLSQPKLKELAEEFCAKELAKPVELEKLGATAWVVYQLDGEVPVKVTGLGVIAVKIDVPVLRVTDSKSAHVLFRRLMSYAADQQLIGQEALIYVSSTESDDQKCPAQADWLRAYDAVKADRWSVTIK